MAIYFDSSQSLLSRVPANFYSAIVPMTVAYWFNIPTTDASQYLLTWSNNSRDDQYLIMCPRATHCEIRWLDQQSGNNNNYTVEATTSYTANQWEHYAGVIKSTDVTVYHNGGGKATDTTNPSFSTNDYDYMYLGILNRSTSDIYATGRMAHLCIWNVGLNDDEIAALGSKIHPLKIRPGNIVSYWPMRVPGWQDDVVNDNELWRSVTNSPVLWDDDPLEQRQELVTVPFSGPTPYKVGWAPGEPQQREGV